MHKRVAMLKVTVVLLYLGIIPINGDAFQQKVFKVVHNRVLVGSVIATYYRVSTEFQCSHKCLRNIRCLSFNFAKKSSTNASSCEINNSNDVLDRSHLIQNSNFNYYRLIRCIPNPCVNGGLCVSFTATFACDCPLSIRVLPYTDSKCSVDKSLIQQSSRYVGVFWAAVAVYKLNFYEAQRLCEILGATLATYDQLYKAWQAGMEKCHYSWLADATVRFPMQIKHVDCGNKTGITTLHPSSKNSDYDTMCYTV